MRYNIYRASHNSLKNKNARCLMDISTRRNPSLNYVTTHLLLLTIFCSLDIFRHFQCDPLTYVSHLIFLEFARENENGIIVQFR